MAIIIDMNGPPGSGKSTLSQIVSSGSSGRILNVGAFGFPCFQLLALVSRLKSNEKFSEGLTKGYHPISLMGNRFRRAILPLLFPIEAVSGFVRFYFRASLLAKKSSILVIDEGLLNTLAFYLEIGRLTKSELIMQALHSLYLRQYQRLATNHEVHIIFVDAPDDVLRKRWKCRGNPVPISAEHFRYEARDLIAWSNTIREMLDKLSNGTVLPFRFHRVDGASRTPKIPSLD